MTTATSESDQQRLQSLVGKLVARDQWTPEQVGDYQRERLRELIQFAVEHSRYYREALGADASERPLEELPVLTKSTLMERFDDVVTDPRLRLADVDEHLAGPDPGADFAGDYALITTSGTTGKRGVFAYSADELRTWLAALLRALARIGAAPTMRLVGIGSPSPLFMSRRVFRDLEGGTAHRPPDLSVTTPMPEIVRALNEFQPEIIMGYPSVHALIAEQQLEGRLEISPRIVVSGSEVLTDDHVRRMEAAWGVRPRNGYVTTEACPIATDTPDEVGLHVCDDLVVIEVVDEAGGPVPPGTPGHRVLLTNLVNRTQPLIRYELTDSLTMAAGPNPTGMPWRRIERVDGRSAEILRLPGHDGEVQLHPHRLREPFASFDEVLQYQFTWDGERLSVALQAKAGAAQDLPERVTAMLGAVLDDAGASGVPVEAQMVDRIEREPGGAAKLKQLKLVGEAAS